MEKRTKKKRVFYGGSNYPKCDFAVWEKPLDIPCPECKGLLVPDKSNTTATCSQCKYKGNIEELQEREPAMT